LSREYTLTLSVTTLNLSAMLRTLLSGITLAVMTIVLAPIAVAAHVLRFDEENSSVQQWCMRTWARSLCWAG
jgi:hypothetical protein